MAQAPNELPPTERVGEHGRRPLGRLEVILILASLILPIVVILILFRAELLMWFGRLFSG